MKLNEYKKMQDPEFLRAYIEIRSEMDKIREVLNENKECGLNSPAICGRSGSRET